MKRKYYAFRIVMVNMNGLNDKERMKVKKKETIKKEVYLFENFKFFNRTSSPHADIFVKLQYVYFPFP